MTEADRASIRASGLLTDAEFRRMAQMAATPIDFEELIAAGVLRKVRAWYEVLDMTRLPEHARVKAQQIKTDGKRLFVKFGKHDDTLARAFPPLGEAK
jgi:hypothetical protein